MGFKSNGSIFLLHISSPFRMVLTSPTSPLSDREFQRRSESGEKKRKVEKQQPVTAVR
jgi:hypothetical protein